MSKKALQQILSKTIPTYYHVKAEINQKEIIKTDMAFI